MAPEHVLSTISAVHHFQTTEGQRFRQAKNLLNFSLSVVWNWCSELMVGKTCSSALVLLLTYLDLRFVIFYHCFIPLKYLIGFEKSEDAACFMHIV